MIYYLSLGSNIEPEKNMPLAYAALKNYFRVLEISTTYETPPIGPTGPDSFWNGVVSLESDLEKKELDIEIKKIEKLLGRVRDPENKFSPRPIDIDIIDFKESTLEAFIIIPLSEICPHEVDYITKKTWLDLAQRFGEEREKFIPKIPREKSEEN